MNTRHDELRATHPGRGFRKDGGGFYFKCGVYSVRNGDRSETWYRNIKIWEKPAPAVTQTRTAGTGR